VAPLLALSVIGWPAAVADEMPDFLLLEAGAAQSIADKSPSGAWPLTSALRPGPAWFFTRIQASARTLERLRSDGKLPIKHKWYRLAAGGQYSEGRPDFEIILDIGSPESLEALQSEADGKQGSYDWRMSSCRQSLPAGAFKVEVTDNTGHEIECAPGGQCTFLLSVSSSGLAASKCQGSKSGHRGKD
jgi:hypothetical protein